MGVDKGGKDKLVRNVWVICQQLDVSKNINFDKAGSGEE